MDNGRYIWCRNCGAIHHVSAFDRSPVYAVAAGEVHEKEADDWRDFMNSHAGHRLEALQASGKSFFPQGLVFDSMNVAYVQVSNGEQTLCCAAAGRALKNLLLIKSWSKTYFNRRFASRFRRKRFAKKCNCTFPGLPRNP